MFSFANLFCHINAKLIDINQKTSIMYNKPIIFNFFMEFIMKRYKKVLLMLFLAKTLSLTAQTAVQPPGSGTAETPYEISTLDHLYWLSQNETEWDKVYVQTADIDASATASWDGGAGFSPIGYLPPTGPEETYFAGSYDGQGHTITGLFINRPEKDCVGLFGPVKNENGTSADIRNVGLLDVDITGKSNVGALAGKIYWADAKRCYSTGSVSGTGNVGGLVGYHGVAGLFIDCYSTAEVHGTTYVGGLIGENSDCGNISQCYATGDVFGTTGVGGLVGRQDFSSPSITDCYSRGSVTGDTYVGGLVGKNGEANITSSYSTGNVTGNSDTGGLAGYNSGSISNCFWDTETSGMSTSQGGTGKTTAEMKDAATFTDLGTAGLDSPWDFALDPHDDVSGNDYWSIDQTGTNNQGYPYLSWQSFDESSLPVEFSGLTASMDDSSVLLKWSTQSEVNNVGFIVERKEHTNLDWTIISSYHTNPALLSQGNCSYRRDYSYRDNSVILNNTYYYRISDVDIHGQISTHQPICIETALNKNTTMLSIPYPNPFNTTVQATYFLKDACCVRIEVVDLRGRKVYTKSTHYKQGDHMITWDGKNNSGKSLPSGIYVLSVYAEDKQFSRKVLFSK